MSLIVSMLLDKSLPIRKERKSKFFGMCKCWKISPNYQSDSLQLRKWSITIGKSSCGQTPWLRWLEIWIWVYQTLGLNMNANVNIQSINSRGWRNAMHWRSIQCPRRRENIPISKTSQLQKGIVEVSGRSPRITGNGRYKLHKIIYKMKIGSQETQLKIYILSRIIKL